MDTNRLGWYNAMSQSLAQDKLFINLQTIYLIFGSLYDHLTPSKF